MGASVAFKSFLGPHGGQWASQIGDAFMTQLQQVLGGGKTGRKIIALDAHKLATTGGGRTEQDDRRFAGFQFAVNTGFTFHPINRCDQNSVHAARKQAAQAGFLPLNQVLGVHQQHVITEFTGAFLDGQHGARENRICGGGNHEADQFGGAEAQPKRGRVGHIAHFLRRLLDAGPRCCRHVGPVAQGFRDGHDGNPHPGSNINKANHVVVCKATLGRDALAHRRRQKVGNLSFITVEL